MHLLDTDTVSHLHQGHPGVAERLRRVDDPAVGTTIVTEIEALRGRFEFVLKAASGAQLLRAQHWLGETERLFAEMLVVPFDAKAAEQFDLLRAIPAAKRLGRADLLIASIALAHRATLVTRNTRHFAGVPGLRTVNWVD
jgi:tRNA(fMet)-specific endonuclease VapC